MSNLMESNVFYAAVTGNLTIFDNKTPEQLQKKTYQKNNIIHIAAHHGRIDFINEALNRFPSTPTCESLIFDQNCHGNTPLHIAAQDGHGAVIVQLYEFFLTQCRIDQVFPLRVTNEDGNTPAHEALLYRNVSIATYLVEKDDYVVRVLNRSKKTLLHLAIQFHDFGNYEEIQMLETQATSSSNQVHQPDKDLWPIVELLLNRESSVACWADADGSTPLHLAATLEPPYCIWVINALLGSCPEAAEVHDEMSGQTILHLLTNHQVVSYDKGIELLQYPQLSALRYSKNRQGDTPLHLAARNRDTTMVRVLLASSPKLYLKNNSGVSAGSLVQQLEEMLFTETPEEEMHKFTKEEREAARQGNVAFLIEKRDTVGMNILVSQTHKGGNILHILMQCKFEKDTINEVEDFIGTSIQRLPLLLCKKDCNGDTPIHLLAQNPNSVRLLELSYEQFWEGWEKARGVRRGAFSCPPWGMKNVKGDTPLHISVRAKQYVAAIKLLRFSLNLAGHVNNRIETPLHLLANDVVSCLDRFIENGNEELMSCLIEGNGDLAYMQDADGLTPLLTAARERNITMIRKLYEQFPDCSNIADFKGKTMWHWFVHKRLLSDDLRSVEISYSYISEILIGQDYNNNDMRRLMASKDNDGNTPLHLAIANRQFGFALFFLDNWRVDRSVKEKYDMLLSVENKQGDSCYNLIGSAQHLPLEFEKHLFKSGNLLHGHRSMYAVPTTKIEAYANTIGVIAALLATITFTAAFTVPGGLDSSNGAPLLLRKAVFQVFMVTDVVAMCSSVMVLFCLLWIMTTNRKKESILLLDVSVFLLQISFHATLLTFMTGFYVTTIAIVPAIAISTIVICTLLIILMHKRLVMLTIVPSIGFLIILGQILGGYAGVLLSSIWSLFKRIMSGCKVLLCYFC